MQTSTDPTPDQAPPPAGPEFHPAAALFPLMDVDGAEFGELVRDLQEHGLLQPIALHEGKILDGRNRYRACQHAGVEPRYVEWDGESPTAYVLSLNLHRRHLTDRQRAAIAVEAMARFEEEAREALLRAGAVRASNGHRVEGRFHQPRPNPDEAGGRDHTAERKRRSDVRAAKQVGVSRHAVRQAERVKDADPALFERVKAGSVQLREAERQVERREAEEMQATLDRIDPEGAVRQRQAKLIADWSSQAAKVGHLVTDLMGFDLDEIVPLLDELNRYAAGTSIPPPARLLRPAGAAPGVDRRAAGDRRRAPLVIDYRKLQQWSLDEAGGDRAAAVDLIVDVVAWLVRLSITLWPLECGRRRPTSPGSDHPSRAST